MELITRLKLLKCSAVRNKFFLKFHFYFKTVRIITKSKQKQI